MEPQDLPDELSEEIALYALGLLPPEEAQRMREHFGSEEASGATEFHEAEQVVALLGHVAPPVSPPAGLKATLLDRIQTEMSPPAAAISPSSALDFTALDWTPSEWPGVSFHWLRKDEETGAGATFIKILPGHSAPAHRHLGAEECLVLQGGFGDSRGQYRAGDLVYYEPGSIHQDFRASEDEDCILFVVYQQSGIEVLA